MICVMGGNKASAKSVSLQNIATYFSNNEQKIAVLDTDVQQSFKRWSERRALNRIIRNFDTYTGYGKIGQQLIELAEQYDAVFVDVKGTNSEEFIIASALADIVLVPLQSTIKSLETLDELNVQYNEVKKINKKIIFCLFQVLGTTNIFTAGNKRNFFVNECGKYNNFKLLNSIICQRDSFEHSDREGKTVFETSDQKAQAEIQQLASEIVLIANSIDY
jgi:cellulose biosynthesis protein BcsQ